jgi:hypothetical protein
MIYKVTKLDFFGEPIYKLDCGKSLSSRMMHRAMLVYEEMNDGFMIYKNYYGKPGFVSAKTFEEFLDIAVKTSKVKNEESSLDCAKL